MRGGAIRELEEELGIKADKKSLVYITDLREKIYDKVTGMTNNVIRRVFGYKYNNEKLQLEKGKATSLEFWPLEKLKNLTEEERRKFIQTLIGEEYLKIYDKLASSI